jgi:hypothetical protein
VKRLILTLALLALPFTAEAQRRGLNFDVMSEKVLVIPVTTAVSQTAVRSFTYTPGFAFRITSVRSYCRTLAGTVSAQIRVAGDTASVLDSAITFTDSTQRLFTVKAAKRRTGFGSTRALSVFFTTDGSGVLTNGFVILRIKPL